MKRTYTCPRPLIVLLIVLACLLIMFFPIFLMKVNYSLILFEPAASLIAFAFGQWALDKALDSKRDGEL